MPELTTTQDVLRLLTEARVVAVLGAHPSTIRPAYYVPDYLHDQGYRILPVNALKAGEVLWGEEVRASLTDLTEPVDVVDVFRRADALDAHLPEILAMDPPPRAVWLQLGIRNDAFTAKLVEAGIDVVQDRCMLADHRRFGLPPRAS